MRKLVCIKKFSKDEEGASLAEYAVLLAVLLSVAVVSLTNLGDAIKLVIDNTTALIGKVPTGA